MNNEDDQTNTKKKILCKMLVLGAADTGKSTLVRNIRMIHNVNFTEEEVFEFNNRIRSDCLSALGIWIKENNNNKFSSQSILGTKGVWLSKLYT